MWPNQQKTANLVASTEEMENFNFLYLFEFTFIDDTEHVFVTLLY